MSETVHYKGTMKKLYPRFNILLQDQIISELRKWKVDFMFSDDPLYEGNLEDALEALQEEDSYFVYKDNLYLVGKNELNPYDDIMSAHKIDDDTIGFEVKYYNGGCRFEEALETALEGL